MHTERTEGGEAHIPTAVRVGVSFDRSGFTAHVPDLDLVVSAESLARLRAAVAEEIRRTAVEEALEQQIEWVYQPIGSGGPIDARVPAPRTGDDEVPRSVTPMARRQALVDRTFAEFRDRKRGR